MNNKIIKTIKLYQRVIISFLFNFLLLIILINNNYFTYATNDDFDMTLSVTGAYGFYSPYTLFSGYWISLFLSKLYQYLPILNWITIINIGAIFIFYTYLLHIFIKKGGRLGLLIGISITLASYPYLYNLNYTKTAGILALLGCLTLSASLEQQNKLSYKKINPGIFLSFILLFLSSQIRLEPMLFMFVYILPLFLHIAFTAKSINVHRAVGFKNLFCILFCIVISILLFISGEITNRQNPDLAFYYSHIDARSEFLDHEGLDYNTFREEFQSINISKNDYDMFISSHYYDADFFNNELLSDMVNLKHNNTKLFTKKRLLNTISIIKSEIIPYSLLLTGIIFAVCFLLISDCTIEIAFTLIISATEIVYLVFLGRYPLRVLFIPMLGLVVVILYICIESLKSIQSIRVHSFITVILILSFFSSDFATFSKQDGWGGNKETTMTLIDALKEQSDNLYIWDDQHIDLFSSYSQYEIVDYDILNNIVFDWDWKVMLPSNIQKTREFLGDTNVYKHCIDKNVYWVGDNCIDLKRAYIREHYYNDIDYAIVDYIGDEPIISFSCNFNKINTNTKNNNYQIQVSTSGDELLKVTIIGSQNQNLKDYTKTYVEMTSLFSNNKYTYECCNAKNNTFETYVPKNSWIGIDEVNISFLLQDVNGVYSVHKETINLESTIF